MAVCWVLWWNWQWRLVIRFWVKRTNNQVVVYLFRIFFAFCLIGSIESFIEQIRRHPITAQNVGPILLTSAIMCGVVATMTAFSVWFAGRRERQASDRP